VIDGWLDRHTSQAPSALRSRVRHYTSLAGAEPHTGAEPLAGTLTAAAHTALARVLTHPGDRSVALDLLAADALITLALLAQADVAPADLEEFAISVLRAGMPDS
jgi:selenocysteine lyase/cysteine desulfurase